MAWQVYHQFKKSQLDGSLTNTPINLTSANVKLMLVTSSYTPTIASDNYRNVATLGANEVSSSGTGYTARGTALSSITVTLSSGTVSFNANDVSWAQNASGFSNARYAVLYYDSGTDSTSPLIAYADLGSNVGNVSGTLTLSINANKILTLA